MAVAFSFVAVLGKEAIGGRSPFAFVAARFVGQSILLIGIVLVLGRPKLPERGERLPLILAGSIGYGSEAALYFSAMNHGTVATVTLLFYTYPVWVMLVTIALDRAAPPLALFGALGLALAGSAMVVVAGGGADIQTLGIVLALCTAVMYTAYLVGTDRWVKRTDPLTAALWLGMGAGVANVTFTLVASAVSGEVVLPSGRDWLLLAGMAAFSALAFFAMLGGLQLVGAVRNAIIGVTEPLSAALLAALFLGEAISLSVAVGGVLILIAAVIAALVRTTETAEPTI